MSDQHTNSTAPPNDEAVVSVFEEDAGSLFFTPRRLGATAPHDCSIWSVDYRDGGDPSSEGQMSGEDTRRLDDESLTEQLETLMVAGLQVKL
jgi:hypothetical protein